MDALPQIEVPGIALRRTRGDSSIVEVVGPTRHRFRLIQCTRVPYLGQLDQLATTAAPGKSPLLWYLPYASEVLGDALTARGWSWIDAQGNFDIRARGLVLHRRGSKAPPRRRAQFRGQSGIAALRWLAADAPATFGATDLARAIGFTQPRASQLLGTLAELQLVERVSQRQWRGHSAACLDAFLAEYKGPEGETSYFYVLDKPTEALSQLEKIAPRGAPLAISGDVAADQLSPRRTPTHLVVYAEGPLNTSALKWTQARGFSDANVIVMVPKDRTLFARAGTKKPALAHVTQIVWDLIQLGGADRLEAAEALKKWLLSRRPTA